MVWVMLIKFATLNVAFRDASILYSLLSSMVRRCYTYAWGRGKRLYYSIGELDLFLPVDGAMLPTDIIAQQDEPYVINVN